MWLLTEKPNVSMKYIYMLRESQVNKFKDECDKVHTRDSSIVYCMVLESTN